MNKFEMKTLLFGIFICIFTFDGRGAAADEDVHWRYFGIYGVEHWSSFYNICDAATHDRQSPIDIVEKDAQYDHTLTPISIGFNGPSDDKITIINNGHTVSFSYDVSTVQIQGGHLNGSFLVGGVHFHWASDNTGSEHRIDAKQYLMEMHIVTYDASRFKGVIEASGGINSIAVFGVLFTLSNYDNPLFAPLISYFKNVTVEGNSVKMPAFPLSSLLPSNTGHYFRYLGSLTTPPCSENVVWTIFKTTQTLSSRQMSEFRKLQEMIEPDNVTIDYLSNNWRPPQPLHGRIVTSSFETSADSDNHSSSTAVPVSSIACLVMSVASFVFSVAAVNRPTI